MVKAGVLGLVVVLVGFLCDFSMGLKFIDLY